MWMWLRWFALVNVDNKILFVQMMCLALAQVLSCDNKILCVTSSDR